MKLKELLGRPSWGGWVDEILSNETSRVTESTRAQCETIGRICRRNGAGARAHTSAQTQLQCGVWNEGTEASGLTRPEPAHTQMLNRPHHWLLYFLLDQNLGVCLSIAIWCVACAIYISLAIARRKLAMDPAPGASEPATSNGLSRSAICGRISRCRWIPATSAIRMCSVYSGAAHT